MIRFQNPIDGENIRYEDDTNRKGIYDTPSGFNVYSPWEGVVQDTPDKCNGYLKIKHNINNEIFYSNFCNLEKQKVSFGHSVRTSGKIGETGNEKLSFWITNDKEKKQSIEDFFKGKIGTASSETKPSDIDKKEKQKQEKNKDSEREKQEKKQKEKESKMSKSSNRIDKEFGTDSELLGLRFMAAPFTIVGSALKEEIERIKQLL